MFSYVQKEEAQSIQEDNSLTGKSQRHEFGSDLTTWDARKTQER